jgi:SagB-type dehydrogenase family enzyme
MTARELGELLYRGARVRSVIDSTAAGKPLASTSDRPYPSGGAAYELDLYVTVHECVGIPRGVYHYDPLDHRLEMVDADLAMIDELLESGRVNANLDGPPPVLITMTARFRRLSWMYSGLAYALALKNVGVLTQTLYLVSTAMGLGACALGSVDIDTAARAFGTNWLVESSVGEFIVGPRRDVDPHALPRRRPAAHRSAGGEMSPSDGSELFADQT